MNTDINLSFLNRPAGNTNYSKEITIFNWNTKFWESGRKEELYVFLEQQNADIYQLQEHYAAEHDQRVKYFLDDEEEIKSHFPDFYFVAKDEFLTISKYPITDSFADQEGTYLETEIELDGNTISFLNIHIPLQLYYPYITEPSALLADTRSRFYLREQKFDILEEEIDNLENPYYISGDFNTTKCMGKMRGLLAKTTDSFYTTNTLFPTTWKAWGLKLWRIDYNLASSEINIISHENIDPKGFSDHWGQKVVIGI